MNKRINESDEIVIDRLNDEEIKSTLIHIELKAESTTEQCITSIIYHTIELGKKWINSTAINEVTCLDNKSIITLELGDVQAWTVPPRIIEKKQCMFAEMMLIIKITNQHLNYTKIKRIIVMSLI